MTAIHANRQTTRNLSAAMKLAKTELPADCTVLVAYDKVSRSWFASYINEQLQQIGPNGRGSDPTAAVEDLIWQRNHFGLNGKS
jgi:hypothetical protein